MNSPLLCGLSLLRTAIDHGNAAMVRLLRDHVTVDDLLGAQALADPLPPLAAGALLDAVVETMRRPAALLSHAVRHWTASAVESLLRHGLPAHHTHLSLAIGRDRDAMVDLFLAGGSRAAPLAQPRLAFGCVKAALDARRADLVLRLLAAGAPPSGAPGDHRVVDRLVALWHGWLTAAGVDVAARMRDGRALAVYNKLLPAASKLPTHRAAGLRLEPVHEVLWALYQTESEHAVHAHCSLRMVRTVAPWVGADWSDGSSAHVHHLYPRRAFDEPMRALLLVAKRSESGLDSLWVSLVGSMLAARGQPRNLQAMRQREADEERCAALQQQAEEELG